MSTADEILTTQLLAKRALNKAIELLDVFNQQLVYRLCVATMDYEPYYYRWRDSALEVMRSELRGDL